MKKQLGIWILLLFLMGSEAQAGKGDVLPSYRFRSLPIITQKITENCSNDSLKTIAILQWMSEHVRFDWFRYDRYLRIPSAAGKMNFRRKGDVQGYVNLFREMCRLAGIETEEVSGYIYTDMLYHGQALFSSNQSWVMVRFNNKWHPISPYQVCTDFLSRPRFHRRIWKKLFGLPAIHDRHKHLQTFDTAYVYPDPQEFRKENLPQIDYAQVLQQKESLSFFERHDSIYNDTALAPTKYHDEAFTEFNSDPLWLQNYKSAKNILKVNPRNYFDASIEHVKYTMNAKNPFLDGAKDLFEEKDTLKFLIKEHGESQKLLRKAFQMNAEEANYFSKGNAFRKKLLYGGNLKNQRNLEQRKRQLKSLLAATKRLKSTNYRNKKSITKTIQYLRKTKYKPYTNKKNVSKSVHLKTLKKAEKQEAVLRNLIQQSDSIIQSIDSLNQQIQENVLNDLFSVYEKIDSLRKDNINEEILNVPLSYEWDIYCRNDTIRFLEEKRKMLVDSLTALRKKSIVEKQNELRKIARVIQKNTEKQMVLLAGIPTDVSDSVFYNKDIHQKIYERAAHAYENYLAALAIREQLYNTELAFLEKELSCIHHEYRLMKKENRLVKQTFRSRKKHIRHNKKEKDKVIRVWQKRSRISKRRQSAILQDINDQIREQKKDQSSGDNS